MISESQASKSQALQLLKELCTIPSPPKREDDLLVYVNQYLESSGYSPLICDGNLILESESGFYITTHLDSVRERVKFHFDGRFAYGTGVCDAKGSIVAILLSLSRIKNLNFGVALLSDEEDGGTGSKKFSLKYKPSMAVVMEPTSLRIANVHFGNVEVEIITQTTEAHGSVRNGENAVEKCLEIIESIKQSVAIKPCILRIEGGDEGEDYVIPPKCRVVLDFLVPDGFKASKILGQISDIVDSVGNAEIKILELCEPFRSLKVDRILAKSLVNSGIKVEFSEMRSWTDGVNLKATGCDVVVWGPGELELCHTSNEKIEINEILKASKVLIELNNLLEIEKVF